MILTTTRLLKLVRQPGIVMDWILSSVRNHTVQSNLKLVLLDVISLGVRPLLLDVSISLSESLAGAVTEGDVDLSGRYPDSCAYEPTPYHVLRAILRHVNSDDTFVDLGCGKGRILWFIATRRRLKRIVGIEIAPELAQIARVNMAKCRLRTPVTVVEGDVSEADLSEGTVYYMSNPFGEKTLRTILEKIRNSLRAHPRSIRILYLTPLLAHVLDEATWLRAGKERLSDLRVWESRT